jgi:hypothetical protein
VISATPCAWLFVLRPRNGSQGFFSSPQEGRNSGNAER